LESFEKRKKKWSQELKRATSHNYENVRHQGERRTNNHLAQWTRNTSTMLPGHHRLSDKLTALFEPCHVRRYGRISFAIRSMGGSVVTF